MCRMLCADCGVTEYADTRLAGRDDVEALAWLLGGLPGWLYCAWRHALRAKRCARCGSGALARESRASAVRAGPAEPPRRRIESRGPLRWPRGLRDPRRRLRWGPPSLLAWALAVAGAAPLAGAVVAALLAVETLGAWRGAQAAVAGCRAWDATGRALRIELA